MFGQTSTPLFGQSSGGLFGQTSTPLFGAQSSQSLFGQASAPSTLFGAQSAAGQSPFGQSSGGLFGAASSSSLFGQPSSSALGIFGAASSQSLFGGQSSTGFWGSPMPGFGSAPTFQQPGPVASQLATPPQQPELGAIRELDVLRLAFVYGPDNVYYRFCHYFLNTVSGPKPARPTGLLDEMKFREAQGRVQGSSIGNGDRLFPVQGQGFGDLLSRCKAQHAAMAENQALLERLKEAIGKLQQHVEHGFGARLESLQHSHQDQSLRLLKLNRRLDALEGRFAVAAGYQRKPDTVRSLDAKLQDTAGKIYSGFSLHIDKLQDAARMTGAQAMPDIQSVKLKESSLKHAQQLLKQYMQAIQKIQETQQKLARDLTIIANGPQEAAPAMTITRTLA